jgi:putative transcriptional regulator
LKLSSEIKFKIDEEIMSIGDVLRYLRYKLRFTQVELARNIGITVSSASSYETGKRQPTLHTIIKISKYAKKHGITIELEDIQPK